MNEPGTIYLTKKMAFCAAHRLFRPEWSDEENLRVFGKCATPGGHGHNYVLEVRVKGRPDPETGMVLDLKELKRIMLREFFDRCDHRDFNRDVDFMRGRMPTAENIAVAAWEVIEPALPPGLLDRVRLHETDRNVVDYYGPGGAGGGMES